MGLTRRFGHEPVELSANRPPNLHRIRRVKCDEEKPACVRCTSTGRTCDGYEMDTSGTRKMQPQQQSSPNLNPSIAQARSRGLQLAPAVANSSVVGLSPSSSATTPIANSSASSSGVVVAAAAASNTSAASVSSPSVASPPQPISVFQPSPSNAPTVVSGMSGMPGIQVQLPLRPLTLVPEIKLESVEREYLDEFIRAAEEGLSYHIANQDEFWRWAVPKMWTRSQAVRHAIVALGAALRTYRQTDTAQIGGGESGGAGPIGPASPQSEVVLMEHYGLAMAELRGALDMPGGLTLALVCCLAFVYIANLRGNWSEAKTHLQSGLTIISTIPLDALRSLADPQGATAGGLFAETGEELACILRCFATLESSACLYTDNFKPIIALELYKSRNLSESIQSPEFTDMQEVHRAVAQFCRDIFALSWIWQNGRSNAGGGGGASPTPDIRFDTQLALQEYVVGQRDVLRLRASRLQDRLRQFRDGPSSPRPGQAGYTSMLLDMLHFTCCKELCSSLGRDSSLTPISSPVDYVDPSSEVNYLEVVQIAESIREIILADPARPLGGKRFMADIGIVCPLHFVVYKCRKETTRQRALAVLEDWPQKENFWDGPEIVRLLRAAGPPTNVVLGREGPLPRSLSQAIAIPKLRERLGGLTITEDMDDGYDEEEERAPRKRGRQTP